MNTISYYGIILIALIIFVFCTWWMVWIYKKFAKNIDVGREVSKKPHEVSYKEKLK